MTDPIHAKIVSLVPEIVTQRCGACGGRMDNLFCPSMSTSNEPSPHWCDVSLDEIRPITLSDALRAIYITWSTVPEVAWQDMFTELLCSRVNCWNLTTDYDGQTDEIKTFIGVLLGVTE